MSSARLALADGSVFEGRAVGASGHAGGEVVFNTSMTGYQEMLTDPSYAGQLLTLTYPMIGNYGVDAAVEESGQIQPRGLIVREVAPMASHLRSTSDLATFLAERGVVAIDGVDTRAITRRIRRHGVMLGVITTDPADEALERVHALPGYDGIDWASQVTTAKQYGWGSFAEENHLRPAVEPKANKAVEVAPAGTSASGLSEAPKKVVLIDGGVKRNIMRALTARNCDITVLPIDGTAEDVLAFKPDGVMWSPGPGDPQVQNAQVEEVRKLIGAVPLFGICLGHQVIARALGAGTFKLPLRAPRREPPRPRRAHGGGGDHRPEPRIRRRPRGAGGFGGGKPRESERRYGRGTDHARRTGDGDPVPLRGEPRTARQQWACSTASWS